MQRHEPEVRNARTQQWVKADIFPAGGEPIEKRIELSLQTFARRGFEMHSWPVHTPRHHLHRLITSQGTYPNVAGQQRFLSRKQQRVPMEYPLKRERRSVLLGGIEH